LRGEQSRAVDDRDDPFAYQAGARRTIAKATERSSGPGRAWYGRTRFWRISGL
jgi:hypothetical protein